jgi:alkanesulfonate monooxygenase SsuD/methylene tetrahydromethanopterin reductase-like flavin-dependent oxidoreductase (luciferase family)
MRLSMQVGYAGSHKESAALVAELEQVGLDVAWIAEAYSYDALSYAPRP